MEIKKELLAPCGLYCGVCRVYLAHKSNDMEFKKKILPTLSNPQTKSVDDIACTGCLSDGVVYHFCQKCSIRDCTKRRNIKGCYQCYEFPCKIIIEWPDLRDKTIMLRSVPSWKELGTEKWVKAEEERYRCPECGYQLFPAALNCFRCNYKCNLDI